MKSIIVSKNPEVFESLEKIYCRSFLFSLLFLVPEYLCLNWMILKREIIK